MSIAPRFADLARRFTRPQTPARKARPARGRPSLEALEGRIVPDRTVLDMTHVHLEAVYDGGALSVQVNDTTNDVIYNPSDVLLYVSAYAEQTQPAGWSFIGAGDGNTYWLLPQAIDLNQLTVAVSGDPIDPGTFDIYQPNDPRITRPGEWIKWSLRDVQGPGDVSIWQDGQAPNAWWASTVDGGRQFDPALYVESGDHTHYNWGFSAAGIYDVTFDVSAFVNGHGLPIHSGDISFRFGVEATGDPTPSAVGAGSRHGIDPALFIGVTDGDQLVSGVGSPKALGADPLSPAAAPLPALGAAAFSGALVTVRPAAAGPGATGLDRLFATVSRRGQASASSGPLQEVLTNGLDGSEVRSSQEAALT
jgi:surface-anchored protein